MRYPWAAFVILGIWTAITIIVVDRTTTQPVQMYMFASAATFILSVMGFV
ncbi:MAG: hypothetical protein AAB483_02510 [Patescibacteria group bacterium]